MGSRRDKAAQPKHAQRAADQLQHHDTLPSLVPPSPVSTEELFDPEPLEEGLDTTVPQQRLPAEEDAGRAHPLQLEQLGRLISQAPAATPATIERWCNAIDLTADRAGLMLCQDLQVARKMIVAEPQASVLTVEKRTQQLLRYSCSANFFELQEQL